jgi:hypothetical protein
MSKSGSVQKSKCQKTNNLKDKNLMFIYLDVSTFQLLDVSMSKQVRGKGQEGLLPHTSFLFLPNPSPQIPDPTFYLLTSKDFINQ